MNKRYSVIAISIIIILIAIWWSQTRLTVTPTPTPTPPWGGANPDYKTSFPSAPSTGTRGQPINVTVCTTNAAPLDKALNPTLTDLYINTSSNVATATLLTNYTVLALLAKSYTNWVGTATIPAGQPTGKNYLIAVCNDDPPHNPPAHIQPESNYNNNTNWWSITIN